MRRSVKYSAILSLLFLSACQSFFREGSADLAGVGGAALATAVTSNGAVATGIGLGVRSAVNAGVQYALRHAQHTEQQAIASAAGSLSTGQIASWSAVHDTPLVSDEHGKVTVAREIGAAGLQCREIIFSVEDSKKDQIHQSFYTAAICKDKDGWGWATAEPATERWGALQ